MSLAALAGAAVRGIGQGVAERKFNSLVDAVQVASNGDVIELRCNGPFDCKSISTWKNPLKKALTIRAGTGCWPVIRLESANWEPGFSTPHWLHTEAPLVLEGLEFQHVGPETYNGLVLSSNGPLRLANCRFVLYASCFAFSTSNSPLAEVRNCHFISAGGLLSRRGTVLLENNVRVGNGFIGMFVDSQNQGQESSFLMKNNTMVGKRSFSPRSFNPEANPKGVGHQKWEASGNVFDLTTALLGLSFCQSISSEKAEAVARETLEWRESRNVFGIRPRSLSCGRRSTTSMARKTRSCRCPGRSKALPTGSSSGG